MRRLLDLLALPVVAVVVAGVVAAGATPADAATRSYASDTMSRVVSGGFGAATVGGAYTVSNPSAASVDGSRGVLDIPGSGRSVSATLDAVAARDVTGAFTVTLATAPRTGNGIYVSGLARVVGKASYQAQALVQPSGAVLIQFLRTGQDGTSAVISSATAPSVTFAPGKPLKVEYEVNGTTTVSLKLRVYPATAAAPAWQIATIDSSSARLTAAGAVGVRAYASSSTPAQAVGFDDLLVTAALTITPSATPLPTPTVAPTPTPSASASPGPTTPSDPGIPAGGSSGLTVGTRHQVGAVPIGQARYPVPPGAVFASASAASGGDGTAARPFASIQSAIDKAPNGGTVTMRAGVYHETLTVPKGKRLTIQAYPSEAVWLDGSSPLTGWTASGGQWFAPWRGEFDTSPSFTKGASDGSAPGWKWLDPAYPMASHPEQVWMDGVALRQVGTRQQLSAGTFFVDAAADRLYLADNPTGRSVRASDLQKAVSLRGDGTVLRGIGIRKFAPSIWMMGALTAEGVGVTIENVVIQESSTIGMWVTAGGVSVRDVTLASNGLLGMGATYADGLTAERVLAVDNNTEHFNMAPVAGGVKISRTRDISIRSSAFLRNRGTGLWLDESVFDARVVGNDTISNVGHGFAFEISQAIDVFDNLVLDNQGNGVKINDTGDVRFWNNTVIGGARTINIVQDSRDARDPSVPGHDPRRTIPDPTMNWLVRNIAIRNNIIGSSTGNCTLCVEDYSYRYSATQLNITSQGNLLQRKAAAAPTWLVIWPGAAGKPGVFTTLPAFASATGQERGSVLVDGQPVTDASGRLALAPSTAPPLGNVVPNDIADAMGAARGSKSVGAFFP